MEIKKGAGTGGNSMPPAANQRAEFATFSARFTVIKSLQRSELQKSTS